MAVLGVLTCKILELEFGRLSVDMAKRLFKHYERSLLISTPIISEAEMSKNVREFNSLFGFRKKSVKGHWVS